MAPTLTSNSFILTTNIPHSRSKSAFSKKAGPLLALGKRGDVEEGEINSRPSFGFGFEFGKLGDLKSLVPVLANPLSSSSSSSGLNLRRKDPGTVFVAGATGQVGIRIAQTLLRQGFSVRAGVPDLAAAQDLARFAADYKIISNEESKRLNAVGSAFEDAESIAKAIGNASKVVVTIGPAENGPTSQVTTSDALQVIQAAQLAKVSHVTIIYDVSSGVGSTYNVLDGISSFFSNLFARSQPPTVAEFLQELVKTELSYTLIKTKLTDDFSTESSYNLVVSPELDAAAAATNDYKVTKSQIALLVGDVFSNTAVAENKVVEVFTDPSAPSKATDELFSAIPEDGRRKAYGEAIAKAKAEEEAIKASEQAREAAEAARKLEEEVKKLEQEEARASSLATEAQKKAEAAGASVESLLSKAKGVTTLSWENLSSQLKSAVQKANDEPKVQIATVRGQAKARSLPSLKAQVKNPPLKKPKDISKTESRKETRKVFGGLFQQETIYIDDE